MFVTATAVADAVQARGYTGAAQHRFMTPGSRRRTVLSAVPDFGALAMLGVFVYYLADDPTQKYAWD